MFEAACDWILFKALSRELPDQHFIQMRSVSVVSLCCICHSGTWRLQKNPPNVNVVCKFSCFHLFPLSPCITLQLSGLMSSCGVRPCLPSGLLCLPDSDDIIVPTQLKSELKQTPHINLHKLGLIQCQWGSGRLWLSIDHQIIRRYFTLELFVC